jgi:hypothetical protein
MGRRSWGKPDFRDLTVEELSNLLYLSYTDSREHQRDYLISLVGFVTYPDLDYVLSVGRNHEEARQLAIKRVQAIDESRFLGAKRVGQTLIDAVNYFTHQAISGDFGPDGSRDGRSSAFLKHSHVIPRAVSIFLENLLIDDEGSILNHDEAEERGAEYIRNNC